MHRMFLSGKCCEEKEIGWWDAQWLGITSLVERVRTGLLRRWYVSPDLQDGVEPPMPRDEERAFLAEGTVSTRTIKWAQAVCGQGTERRFMWWGCSGAEEERVWDEAGELLRPKSFKALRVEVKTGVLLPKQEKPLRSSAWEERWSTFPVRFCQKSFIIKPKKIKLDLIKNFIKFSSKTLLRIWTDKP